MIHQSDPSSFHNNGTQFYVPRCDCGWEFGPVPDLETVCDVLMEHAQRAEQDVYARLNGFSSAENAEVIAEARRVGTTLALGLANALEQVETENKQLLEAARLAIQAVDQLAAQIPPEGGQQDLEAAIQKAEGDD